MYPFLETPHLPKNPVSLCAVSAEAEEVIDALKKLQITVLPVEPNPELDWPVASHADMQLHHLGGNQILVGGESPKQIAKLAAFGFHVETIEPLQKSYPGDCLLNAARIGSACICNQKQISKVLLEALLSYHVRIIQTAQGYSKCSICILNETACITADVSIARAAHQNHLDTLLIAPGQIAIPKYDAGFIGGCCGKLDRNLIAFTGDIARHSDYKQIKAFMKQHQIEIVCLTKDQLLDVGGILPLCEVR